MKIVRSGGKARLEISRSEWERVGTRMGWIEPGIAASAAASLVCRECGQLVEGKDLRLHLLMHDQGAAAHMADDEVRGRYRERGAVEKLRTASATSAASVEIKPYGNRFFAVYVDGELLAVTLYRKGALAVGGLLDRLWRRIEDAEGRIRFRGLS